MKLKRSENTHTFDNLGNGDLFNCEGHFFIKTKQANDKYQYNCVNVETGMLDHVGNEKEVTYYPHALIDLGC